MNFEIKIRSLEQTANLAQKLAVQLSLGDVIALKGDLGAGKTTFSKYLISSLLGKETAVTSPTFQLLQIYSNIYHYDLYRLRSQEEIYELGIEDALNGKNIVIIEWPEIIMQTLPKKLIEIEILLENKNRKCIVRDHSGKLSL
jgi:tRNA threonylcarbamoyladenosine biosynthesis protein TsaE